MSRVKSGVVTHARHRKVIKAAKGYYAARSTNFRTATQAVDKANQYATRDRKTRKRNFRALWIQRINAAVRLFDAEFTYSRLCTSPTRSTRLQHRRKKPMQRLRLQPDFRLSDVNWSNPAVVRGFSFGQDPCL